MSTNKGRGQLDTGKASLRESPRARPTVASIFSQAAEGPRVTVRAPSFSADRPVGIMFPGAQSNGYFASRAPRTEASDTRRVLRAGGSGSVFKRLHFYFRLQITGTHLGP